MSRSPTRGHDSDDFDDANDADELFVADEDSATDEGENDVIACPSCGASLAELADLCPSCGEWITSRARFPWWIVATAAAVLAALAWSILRQARA